MPKLTIGSPPSVPRPSSPSSPRSPDSLASPASTPKTASPNTAAPSSQASAPKNPGNLSANDKQKLSDHIGKKAEEQKVLDKWNANGQGRNQGLVHLIDYSYARPNKIDVNPPAKKLTEAEKKTLSQGNMESWDGAKWQKELGAERFKELNDKGYFRKLEGSGNKPVVSDQAKWNNLSAQQQQVSSELNATNAQLKQETKDYSAQLRKDNTPKNEIGGKMNEWKAQNPTAQKQGQLSKVNQDLEQELANGRRYTLETDASKAGRLGQIEKASQLPPGSLKGNEIKGGTQALEQQMAQATSQGAGPKVTENKPGKDLTNYAKDDQGHWKEQTVKAEDLKSTYSSDQTANGLNVKKWGLAEDNMKLSTVMGASGDKK